VGSFRWPRSTGESGGTHDTTGKLAAISHAKAETDRLDARTLAWLLALGHLEEVSAPDD
jgi:hypothetical protein